jgi:RNA polymerase sigma-70 factor (ECF subfamily)
MQSETQKKFVERFLKEQHRIFGYVVTLVPQRADAEEIFQETSLLLWEKWEEFDQTRDLLPWACGIAHNVVRNYLRKKRPTPVGFDDEMLSSLAGVRLAREDALATRRASLEECLQQLRPQQRKIVEQCYGGGGPLHELAATLGLSANALYLKLRRLREVLLDCVTRRAAREARS